MSPKFMWFHRTPVANKKSGEANKRVKDGILKLQQGMAPALFALADFFSASAKGYVKIVQILNNRNNSSHYSFSVRPTIQKSFSFSRLYIIETGRFFWS